MKQRENFVAELESGRYTMSELCAQYGISRKTGYKWQARFAADGADGLRDRSRRPHGHPATTDEAIVAAVLAARRRFPDWSGEKLVQWLERREPNRAWPGRTTAYQILQDGAAVRRRRPRERPVRAAGRLPVAEAANDLWTTDFKGEFLTRDGRYCYPLTLRDAFSRRVLRCDALLGQTTADTRRRFERAFAEFGLPRRIRSDNGRPFVGNGLGGLSTLNVWWLRLGIALERITPGHPEQNGSHEQFHGVLKRATTCPPAGNAQAQQRRFNAFCRVYNEERPHDALHGRVPADLYVPSPRSLPRRLPPLEYATFWEVRRVSSNGDIMWRGRRLFVSHALGGLSVGFEAVDDALYTVWFGRIALARFDERQWRLTAVRS
jgi:transposase InsO family protein